MTVLIENTASSRGIKAEHGFSVWIETEHANLLWDTGQSALLLYNAQKLGIPIASTSHIVLSHGHYDHTGGLFEVLKMAPHARVFAHPDIFVERYSRNKKTPVSINSIGNPFAQHGIEGWCGSLNLNTNPSEILPGIYTTGEIPRKNKLEDTGGDFFLDVECTQPDDIIDDQALYLQSSQGLIVILGCAHSGVINTLNYIAELTQQKKIFAVMGGMHLSRASGKRLEATAETLARYDVRMIAPCHCTGIKAILYLRSQFPDQCVECMTGSRFAFAASNT